MKYKMGWLGEVEVPEGLIEIFQGWGIEGCKMDCEKCDSFDDCLSQFMGIERYDIYPDYIYPKDIAEFTVNYVCENDPDGPPFQADIEVGGWMVIAYGVVPYDASNWEPRMLAYHR